MFYRYEFLISSKNAFGYNKAGDTFSFATKGAGERRVVVVAEEKEEEKVVVVGVEEKEVGVEKESIL